MIHVMKNISHLATCKADGPQSEIHIIKQAAIAWECAENPDSSTSASSVKGKSKILWVGPEKNIPDQYKDKEGYWTGFAARARVIIVNSDLVDPSNAPSSIFDLTADHWKNKLGIANPLFGTTSTHVAALFTVLGEQKAKQFFMDILKNGVRIVDGNSVVRDQVGSDPALPQTYCYCGAGFYQGIWEEILGKPVRVEVLESVMTGGDVCQIAVYT